MNMKCFPLDKVRDLTIPTAHFQPTDSDLYVTQPNPHIKPYSQMLLDNVTALSFRIL